MVSGSRYNGQFTVVPPTIMLIPEVRVNIEPITKELILSMDRGVTLQGKVTRAAVAWPVMDIGTWTLRNTWSPNPDLPSLLLSPSLLEVSRKIPMGTVRFFHWT